MLDIAKIFKFYPVKYLIMRMKRQTRDRKKVCICKWHIFKMKELLSMLCKELSKFNMKKHTSKRICK